MKVLVAFLCVVLCLNILSCSKTKPSSENQNQTETKTSEEVVNNWPQTQTISVQSQYVRPTTNVSPTQTQTAPEPKRDYLTMDEFLKEREGLYEKGGITLYDAGEIYDVPENFGIETHRVFGLHSEYVPPEEPYKEIEITFIWEDDYLHLMLPTEVYEKNPEVYLEAEHDGKTFVYICTLLL